MKKTLYEIFKAKLQCPVCLTQWLVTGIGEKCPNKYSGCTGILVLPLPAPWEYDI